MLKYQSIIDQLSERDKLRAIADIEYLSDEKFTSLGVPPIRCADVGKYLDGIYPTPCELARSWDPELIRSVAESAMTRMASAGVGLALLPSARIAFTPCGHALSEDALLSSSVSGEYLRAAERAGVGAAITDFYLSEEEIEALDRIPDKQFVCEYILLPSKRAAREGRVTAVCTDAPLKSDGGVNAYLKRAVGSGAVSDGAFTVCHGLSSASGLPSHEIDAALDRLIGLAFSLERDPHRVSEVSGDDDRLARRAAHESIVMVKNWGDTLPIKSNKGSASGLAAFHFGSVGIIGDLAWREDGGGASFASALAEELTLLGVSVGGCERGYDAASVRSGQLLDAACELAERSSTVVVFLGLGDAAGHVLSANQQELLFRLGACRARVVAVLSGDVLPDLRFDGACDAILVAPINTEYAAGALARVLVGEESPCGRLTSTLYVDSEPMLTEYRSQRRYDHIKVGRLVGYRFWDSADLSPGYPIGHGIGYTEFVYSDLSVEDGAARFTVKNVGRAPGVEVAQVYVGAEIPECVRPRRELGGFVRIALEPKESMTVSVPITFPMVYDLASGEFISERGEYRVFVSASLADVRLTCRVSHDGAESLADGGRLSDYIATEAIANTEDFKIEAKEAVMKKSHFHMISGAAAFVLAIVLKLYCTFTNVDTLFFDLFSIALGIVGLGFFTYEAVRGGIAKREARAAADAATSEMFADAEEIPYPDAAAIFESEMAEGGEKESETEDTEPAQPEVDGSEYINHELTFVDAVDSFVRFASEKGFRFDREAVERMFASLAASRIVLVRGMSAVDFDDLTKLLGGYFGCEASPDTVDASYTDDESLLALAGEDGTWDSRGSFTAIEAARSAPQRLCFVALDGVVPSGLPAYFSSYAEYAGNPRGVNRVRITRSEGEGDGSCRIPRNVWFLLNLSDTEPISAIPAFVSGLAALVEIRFERVMPADSVTPFAEFSYYQLEHLTERALSEQSSDETLWKKVDRLADFVASRSEYSIGNKCWLALERFVFVYIACGGERALVADRAVAAKLMSGVLSALGGAASEGVSLADVLDDIFGEDVAESSKSLIA